jgi:His-Xaa-Ser system radical SAM maturase HxsC
MIRLHGRVEPHGNPYPTEGLFIVAKEVSPPLALRHKFLAIDPSFDDVDNYACIFSRNPKDYQGKSRAALYYLDEWCDYLLDGDIIRLGPALPNHRDNAHVLFRAKANSNSVLLTERCDHYCLMCSQPPKKNDDSVLLEEAFQLLSLIPADTTSIGLTGGEPTLYGDQLIELIEYASFSNPAMRLDLLTNGKRFSDMAYSQKLASVGHKNLLVCVPLYSYDPEQHDFVVQCRGAFDPTIQGIINLKATGTKVQVRIVLHRETIPTLLKTAQFIAMNLRFIDEVALMGLETIGFAKANLDSLWVDPYSYQEVVKESVQLLADYGIPVYLFNQQLCLISPEIELHYVKSISDWKNDFVGVCVQCSRRHECGGFFSSNVDRKYSQYLKAFV